MAEIRRWSELVPVGRGGQFRWRPVREPTTPASGAEIVRSDDLKMVVTESRVAPRGVRSISRLTHQFVRVWLYSLIDLAGMVATDYSAPAKYMVGGPCTHSKPTVLLHSILPTPP